MARMRLASIGLALTAALALAACGGGGTAVAPTGGDSSVLQLSFGSETPGATGTTTDTTVVCIMNYTNASILEAGIRPFGSTEAYQGSLTGHDPATFGAAANGGAAWVELGAGAYEGFLETDQGRLEFHGNVKLVTLPDGTYTVAPTCLYLFTFDLIPDTGGGAPDIGGGGAPSGGGGGTFTPGGSGGGVGP